jgi:GTP-binding protein Era
MSKTKTQHSGFAALIGRPNVGKSTLLNRIVGEKLAIVSSKPQTTRNRILGVINRPQGQLALLDTPGIHQAKGELNRYMVEVALNAASEVELVLFLVEPPEGAPEVSPGNRYILEKLQQIKKPTFLVINKVDAVEKPKLLPLIDRYRQEFPFAQIVPISAREGDGVEVLLDQVYAALPEGPPMFDPDTFTDQAERQLVAEYIREQVMRHCRQEVPYSTAVVVEVFDESDREPLEDVPPKAGLAGLVRIHARIFVERDSQKAIVIGKRGQMLKTIGTDARKSIERLLGTHVYLSLQVKVEPRWSERQDALRKLGYE